MKWFLIGLAAVICSTTWVRGQDAGAELYKKGSDEMQAEQYDKAVADFDAVLNGYPNTPNIDDVHLSDGYAYLHLGKFTEAIDRLAKEAAPSADAAHRGTALYLTGLAQFSLGEKLLATDKAGSGKAMQDAAATMTELCKFITANPTPDNKGMMEDAIYYRALAQYEREDYTDAEKDLLLLLQSYPASQLRPDYLLLLGSLYAVETNQMIQTNNDPKTTVQKTPDEIRAMAQKALNAFDQVSNDPNALVQANTANYSKAEILYLIAQLDAPATEGYQKALDAFRQVRRKDDMVEIQTHRLEQLKKNSAEALQNGAAGFANTNSRLIDREQGHLTDLQKSADPIIEAYVRMSECYISLKQPEEARTILRRLMIHAYADMPADLKQEVDFQLLYSYVLGGETDQADATLTTYLGKYPADPQADSISYQIGSTLMGKKVPDFEGAVKSAQRSLKDFPKGRFAAQAYAMEAQALSRLGRLDEAKAVLAEAAKLGGTGITADQNLLTTAETQIATGDLAGALSSYQKVIDDAKATDEIRGIAAAGHIRVLMLMQKYDQVVTEAKDFAGKFPSSKAMSGVLLYGALALDKKTPPDEAGAIAGLQDLAKKFPADDTASYALFYVVVINQRMGDMPAMTQAAKALTAAYPKSYTLISNVADLVSAEDVKKKQYADAIALYQPLISAPQHDVAAGAQNKVGDIWLTSAKSMGAFQSMQLAMREDAKNRALSAEQAYLATLTNFSDQVDAVGNAFEGLMNVLVLRRSWGLMKDADLAGYLDKLAAPFTDHDMKTRFDLAKDGLVFVYKNGQKQYADALHQFESSIDPNPDLRLTRQEADQFGELLLAGQKYPDALKVYQDLLDHADKNDEVAQGDGYYGLGATYTAECDVAKAAEYFAKLTKLPGGGMWHPHIQDAQYGLALEAEVKGDPDGSAKKTYSELMQSPTAGIPLQSKALIGYGRLLEKAGFVVKPSADGPNEFAIHYFLEVDTIYGPAVPELSAEGIFDAGQAYEKIGDKVNAKAQYKKLLETYGTTASDWAAKAKEASDKLGA